MLSKFFIYRPIFASVISIVIVIVGAVALVALPVNRYPEIAPPTIQVSATYPGATAETIAETVATPIEQEVNGVEDMISMTSTSSSDGTMNLNVTFEPGTDLDMSTVLVQNRVAIAESKLPEEVRRLGITTKKKSPEMLLVVSLFSPDDRYDEAFLNNYVSLRIKDEILRVPGVGDVMTFGAEYGMRVWLDPDRMRARGLTTNDVVNAIREQNVQVAAGQIGEPPAPEGQAFQLTVNTLGRLSEVPQFENIVIKTGADGRVIRVKDVAEVELGADNYSLASRLDGRIAATFATYLIPGENAIESADGILAKMDELAESFPEGLEYTIAYDATLVIRASIEEVVVTLFITLLLVVLTVYIFLQDVRATIVPTLTIPVSLIGTFAVMAALGFSLNIMSLFGLILVIGIVVDDAIVVVENTTRLIEEGLPPKEAAVQSMKEVTGPVIATTLVLLAVFVPTVFMAGIVGELFKQFAVTISVATVFSSINALTMSPALCGVLLKPKKKKPLAPFRAFNAALEGSRKGYLLGVKVSLRLAVIGIPIFAAFVGLAVVSFGSLPTGFVPQEDEGVIFVNVQLPDAASMERTQAVTDQINDMLVGREGIQAVVGITGFSIVDESRASNKALLIATLTPWDERSEPELSQDEIVARLNRDLAQIQEAVAIAFVMPSLPGVGNSGGLSLQLQDRGGSGLSLLETVAESAVADANSQEAMTGVFTTFRANVSQIFLEIDRDQAKTMGIPLQAVFDTLAAFMGSTYINDFNLFGRIYKVKAQAYAKFRAQADQIRQLEIRAPDGKMIPLGTLMNIEESFGPQTVTHFNIYSAARISAQPAPGYSSGQSMAVMADMLDRTLPPSMGYGWTDLSYQESRASTGMAAIFMFSVLIVYLVLAAQYESWSIPVSVVLAVPTALLGAVAGIMLGGFDNNVYTQIGIVLLIGLSTKTAILIVEFAKVERESGKSVRDAALNAASLRFRAVLMTAFSFILGMIPLLIASGAGAASRRVLGTTVFAGMLAATVLGVLVIPMLYFVVQHSSERLGRVLGRGPARAPEASPEAG